MDRTITIRIKGTWLRYLAVILVTVLIAAPTAVWASHGFTDVVDNNTFHDDIDWLADNAITLGCNPPANDEFCPKDKVSREQMAAFMRRFATNLSPRAAFDSSTNLPDVGGTALTATITAPVGGFLIINASVYVQRFDAATNFVVCAVEIDGTTLSGSFMVVDVGGSDDISETCGTGGAEIVEAGVHTINLEILSLAAGTILSGGFLTVLFVPFDANGQTPTP